MSYIGVFDEDIYELISSVLQCDIRRASHVEVTADMTPEVQKRIKEKGESSPNAWWVDFSPLGWDTLLGPFKSRTIALAQEKEYLIQHLDHTVSSTHQESE